MTSTAVTSTGIRSTAHTQSLTVPATQNTAPILEFKCLYTNDLRRKQKRWQDGMLRFHTFNKRVMVYELPSRNYIGDTHRRDEAPIDDGDEFKLDRGVLIQVGEAQSSVEQDLTELLEKRKKPRHMPNRQDGSSHLLYNNVTALAQGSGVAKLLIAQPSQLRPKSLNALLGTPTGKIGRAALSSKSPYERRGEQENAVLVDSRPAKRQRLGGLSEERVAPAIRPILRNEGGRNLGLSDSRVITNLEMPLDSEQSLKQQQQPGQQPRRNDATTEAFTDLAPDLGSNPRESETSKTRNEESRNLQARERSKAVTPAKFATDPPQNDSGSRSTIPKEALRQPLQSPFEQKKTVYQVPSISEKNVSTAERPIEVLSDTESTSTNKPPRPRMKLQMATRKPRLKLMYMDLLPQERPVEQRSSSKGFGKARIRRGRSASVQTDAASNDLFRKPQQAFSECSIDGLGRARTKDKSNKSPNLFLSQEDPETLSTVSDVKRTATSKSKPTSDMLEELPGTSKCKTTPQLPKSLSTVHDTAATLGKMDEILFPKSRVSEPSREQHADVVLRTPSSAPFTSKQPSNNASISAQTTHPPPTTLVPSSPGFQTQDFNRPAKITSPDRTALTTSQLRLPTLETPTAQSLSPPPTSPISHPLLKPTSPINRPFKPPKPRSSLKKSISDTSNMRTAPAVTRSQRAQKEALPSNGEQAGEGEDGGLWTKEAWDLFGCRRDGVVCGYEEFRQIEGLFLNDGKGG
ncbi:hypothetical protein MMC21_004392 [Puttea exsequens]|nr:hypothetical protein [Puttea exsequens]